MNGAESSAAIAQAWLTRLSAPSGGAVETAAAGDSPAAALAVLAAEALARGRSLLVVTAGDEPLADISNALDLDLRPLCLALPGADYACRIALRATLSLLKSRLARAGADTAGPAWAAQRQRLAAAAALWQDCLAWSARGLDTEPWPEGLPGLFAVRILPLALARRLGGSADWVVLAEPLRLPEDARGAWPGALRTLTLNAAAPPAAGALVAVDAAARLRAELEVLTQELSDLELELATAQAEVADFTRRYHALIGTRMTVLDELRAELLSRRAAGDPEDLDAGRRADAARARAERSRREAEDFAQAERDDGRPFQPTGELKKLYRQLAQKIHPDRARSEPDRAWRTQLMAEANRAYRAGDARGLREVLALWQEGAPAEPVAEKDIDRLQAQVAGLRRRIAEIEGELNRLFGSKLYELYTAAGIARRAGRDLLAEMADRLEADIAAARGELAAFS